MANSDLLDFLHRNAEIFGHATFILIFISFLLRNIVHLRIFSMLASCCSLVFSFLVPGGPIWVPIRWNLLFICVNTWQIASLSYQRRKQTWGQMEHFVHSGALKDFPEYELKHFLNLAKQRTIDPGVRIVSKGSKIDHLFLALEGQARVSVDGREIAILRPGNFIGEMSFLTNSVTRADVIAGTKLVLLEWNKTTIQKWISQDPARRAYIQAALSGQLIKQLEEKS